MAPIFQQVIATQDRYGLQAYLTCTRKGSLRGKLEEELRACTGRKREEKTRLLKILQTGVLLAEETVLADSGPGEISVPVMIRLLEISNHTLFWYYLASNLAYLTMLIVALKTSAAPSVV